MTRNWTKLILGIAATAALAIQPAWSAERVEKEQLQSMAREASTAADHAAVARQYRLHAESHQAQAEALEARVNEMAESRRAMSKKWPAMTSQSYNNAKRDAIEARRAAQENLALAHHHIRMTVEAQAGNLAAGQHTGSQVSAE